MAEATPEQTSSYETLENTHQDIEQPSRASEGTPDSSDDAKLQEAVEKHAKKILNRKEEIIWRGTPRHTKKIKAHLLSFLLISVISYLGIKVHIFFFPLLIIPIVISFIKFVEVKSTIFEITNKRLKIKEGIFSSVTNEIELYHIKNTVLEEKRNNKGFITFYTTNEKFDKIKFPRMNNPAEIHDQVRDIYEEIKLERNKITHTKK